MDASKAKAEVAHGKRDLKESRRTDIWARAIEAGRQQQLDGEQQRSAKDGEQPRQPQQ